MAKSNLNIKLGKGDSRIEEWLNLQTNKSWSLKFLIKQAIRAHGMTDVQAMLEESTLASTHTRRSPSETPTETHIKAQGSPEDLLKITESFTF
jgi:hypothetical protein